MIISSTNAFILQHRVNINFKKTIKQSSFDIKHKNCWRRHLESMRSAPNARSLECERLDHNQNDPECNDERHGAPISFIWVEWRTTNYVIPMIRSIQTLALETASVWIIIRMIRSAITNDTEHQSHWSGSNDEWQITWSGWSEHPDFNTECALSG